MFYIATSSVIFLTSIGSYALSWSPDGTRVTYELGSGTQAEVWIKTADSDQTSFLVQGSEPKWSPTGDQILYQKDGIRIIDADGSGNKLVSPQGGDAIWLPDGQSIAFTAAVWQVTGNLDIAEASIWQIQLDGTGIKPLIPPTNLRPSRLVAHRDGYIFFSLARSSVSFDTDPYSLDLNTEETQRLPTTLGGETVWFPDRSLAVVSASAILPGITLVAQDGTVVRSLAETGGGVALSPDGQWVTYGVREDSEYSDLFAVRTDGSERIRLTEQTGDATSPVWSPQGTTLAYRNDINGEIQIEFIRPPALPTLVQYKSWGEIKKAP